MPTAQKTKFFIKDFFSKRDQIRNTFTEEILIERLHFCAVVSTIPRFIFK